VFSNVVSFTSLVETSFGAASGLLLTSASIIKCLNSYSQPTVGEIVNDKG
jgi:hypothetical protein